MRKYKVLLCLFLVFFTKSFAVSPLLRKQQAVKRSLATYVGNVNMFMNKTVELGDLGISNELVYWIRQNESVIGKKNIKYLDDEPQIPSITDTEVIVDSVLYDAISSGDQVLQKNVNVFKDIQTAINVLDLSNIPDVPWHIIIYLAPGTYSGFNIGTNTAPSKAHNFVMVPIGKVIIDGNINWYQDESNIAGNDACSIFCFQDPENENSWQDYGMTINGTFQCIDKNGAGIDKELYLSNCTFKNAISTNDLGDVYCYLMNNIFEKDAFTSNTNVILNYAEACFWYESVKMSAYNTVVDCYFGKEITTLNAPATFPDADFPTGGGFVRCQFCDNVKFYGTVNRGATFDTFTNDNFINASGVLGSGTKQILE